MTSFDENEAFEDALQTARMALMDSIAKKAAETQSGEILNELAEAYAWVVQPNQPHGSRRK